MIRFIYRVGKALLLCALVWFVVTNLTSIYNASSTDMLTQEQQEEEFEHEVEDFEIQNQEFEVKEQVEDAIAPVVKLNPVKTSENAFVTEKVVSITEKPSVETSKATATEQVLKTENPVINPPKVDSFFQKPPNIFGNDSFLGEFGIAVHMPKPIPANIRAIYDDGKKKNSFNQYVSDLISFHRKVPDPRTDYCKDMMTKYNSNLPPTSVIIIFHNEAWSTLMRSVHSVLDRSPDRLIEEIILVDDFSDMGELVAFSLLQISHSNLF
jgi:hypothetical protein